MLPALLAALALSGCKEEVRYLPLPEPVDLEMTVNGNTFVMGEKLVAEILVKQDADGTEKVSNEEFDVYFTARDGSTDVSDVFEPFNRIVSFPEGAKGIRAEFPVRQRGIDGTTEMEFLAFARGYRIENASCGVRVSDYHRIRVSMADNDDKVVTEGDRFVLVAGSDKPVKEDVVIRIKAAAGCETVFADLPESLTLLKGRTSAKSGAITVRQDFEATGDKTLGLEFASECAVHPLLAESERMSIRMTDAESLADPKLFDMTEVYTDPDCIFRSYDHPWFDTGGRTSILMTSDPDLSKISDMHPNPVLADAGWKFEYAFEFHAHEGAEGPGKLGNATDANRGTLLRIDKNKYSRITGEGALSLFVGAESGGYATAGIHVLKMMKQVFAQNTTRIYPGMRIEAKVRVNGPRTGFVPMIEVKNPKSQGRDGRRSICLFKNEKKNQVTQLVKGETAGDSKSTITMIPKIGDYQIYWMEFEDEETIHLGINGSRTLTVRKDDLASWPFTKEATEKTQGRKGLYLIFRWDLYGEQQTVSPELPDGWDEALRKINPADLATEGPRMEIDWVRIYTNGNYVRTAEEKVNRTSRFY